MSALGLALFSFSGLVQPTDAFPVRVIEPQAAAETFIATCWRGLRDPGRFSAAASESALRFTPAPSRHGGNRQKSEQAEIHHFPDLEYCTMTVRLATGQDVDRFIALLTEKLGLRAPERNWVMDVGTAMYQWAEVPIDCRHYYLEAEADIAARNPPIDLEISVAFTNRMGAPAGPACSTRS
jgi:hypothetical protein